MVLLFLFIKYWDDFHLELLDVIGGQQNVVEHLDQILHYNHDVVTKSIQPVLHQVLDEYLHFKKNQRRMQTATVVICDAIQSILSSSTNHDFRTKSLQLLKVHSADGGHVQSNTESATPETSQENLYDIDDFQRIHSGLDSSKSDQSFTSVDSDSLRWSDESAQVMPKIDSRYSSVEQTIGTRKRRLEACSMKPCTDLYNRPFKKPINGTYNRPRMEYGSADHVSLLKEDAQVTAPIPTKLTSEATGYLGVQCSIMSTKQTISGKPTEDQEEYLWLQEVSNLSDWTH
ncbi:DUF4554 domain-containing protein isoform X2 [Heterodontus francisci]|uniref:DUF4554 domain-containing protein isoform X2 n=1 Tax=Heterodontus francisci TaxID=7792 RepID=UPI00355BED3F